MPWAPSDAPRHTKKAKSKKAKKQWSVVADKILRQTGDEGRPIREADAAVAKRRGLKGLMRG